MKINNLGHEQKILSVPQKTIKKHYFLLFLLLKMSIKAVKSVSIFMEHIIP